MSYFALKTVHVTCVVISYALFFIRGVWMMRDSPMLARRWVMVVPHVNDTMLLASAVAITVMIREYPFVSAWLTAKVIGLVVYIGLGMMALKRGPTKRARIAAWIAAQAVFFYVAITAVTRSPIPFLG